MLANALRQSRDAWRQTPAADSLIGEATRKGRIVIQLSWSPPTAGSGFTHAQIERVLWGGDSLAAQSAREQVAGFTFVSRPSHPQCPRWATQVLVWPTDEVQRVLDDLGPRGGDAREGRPTRHGYRDRLHN